MSFTIGSLFDGSGGFPLAATMCGGTPKWASEIEPYPIAVTKSRFPIVKHLGSVTDINGGEIEPVDVITFGSPCQDLSVAGKRAGLKHEANGDDETTRSGLFMEAVRIIKEMREATNGVYPRFALWENVPGAFSSNKGEDFRIVLQELIQIAEPTAVMPEVPKNGWPYADSYCGDGWSIAYRVLDAQYWGVPQRRRRIYLVADFRGECAGKVSFERNGLRGYFETSRTPWQTATQDAENCPGAADCEGVGVAYGFDQGATRDVGVLWLEEQSKTLTNGSCPGHHNGVVVAIPYTLKIRSGCDVDANGKSAGKGALIQKNQSATLSTTNDQYLFQPVGFDVYNQAVTGNVTKSLTAIKSDADHVPVVCTATRQGGVAYSIGNGQLNQISMAEQANTLDCMHDQQAVVYSLDEKMGQTYVWEGTANTLAARDFKQPQMVAFQTYQDKVGALCARDYKGVGSQYVGEDKVVVEKQTIRYIVRRLTPTECARLQGFPNTWGHPDVKTELTDEEYQFWLNVRNTHAAINGKTVKGYTKEQILKWYNGLHTDSSEYKMWGNGIALPNALYMMQGIADVMSEEKAARKKWLDNLLGGCL